MEAIKINQEICDNDWALTGTPADIGINSAKREEALYSVFKDPDEARLFIDFKWKDLPGLAHTSMVIWNNYLN